MADLIDRQTIIEAIHSAIYPYFCGAEDGDALSDDEKLVLSVNKTVCTAIKALPSVDAVEVVRCKDCKHRPTGESRDDLEFPDDKCPCKCEDYWYSWKPSDNWFCGNGERKDSNYRGERKYG